MVKNLARLQLAAQDVLTHTMTDIMQIAPEAGAVFVASTWPLPVSGENSLA
jgi:hypothetical protein